jgi:Fe-S cluster biogenesis protein NfuA
LETTVKIRAEVLQHDPASCKFTLDRSVFRSFVRFGNRERAQGSPLAERLFAIEGVKVVLIQGQEVTVSSEPPVNWRMVGPLIGAALRAHLESGEKAVSEEALQTAPAEDQMRQKIQQVLDEQINPSIASHGGTISLLDVRGDKIFIKMGGGCQGCSSASATLRQGVETALRQQVPGIGEILDITDHASGTNPYYSAH